MKQSVDFISDGISSITAEKLFNGLAALKDDMRKTASYVEVISEEKLDKGSRLDGMSFCFTGAMEYKRADLEKMVVDNGGVVSSVNKNLTYLVQQDPNSTSGKSEKAKKLGIKVISPTEFCELLKKYHKNPPFSGGFFSLNHLLMVFLLLDGIQQLLLQDLPVFLLKP